MCVSAGNSVRVNVRVGMAALGLAFILSSLTNEPFHALVLWLVNSPRAGLSVLFTGVMPPSGRAQWTKPAILLTQPVCWAYI